MTHSLDFEEVEERILNNKDISITIKGKLPVQPLPYEAQKNPLKYISPYPSFYEACDFSVEQKGYNWNQVVVRLFSTKWYPDSFIELSFDQQYVSGTVKLSGSEIPTDLDCSFSIDDEEEIYEFHFEKPETEFFFDIVCKFL